jgi:hypothetical protein
MTRIILDADLRHKLLDLREPLELCDEGGAIVAKVVPVVNPNDYEKTIPPLDEEELQRREQSNAWFTTEQVLAQLRSLENK